MLEQRAELIHPQAKAFWPIYGQIKAELATLCGWQARHPMLAAGYDIAHQRILAALERTPAVRGSHRPRAASQRRGGGPK
jgi:hypothetical protein